MKLEDKSQLRGLRLDQSDIKNIDNALKIYESLNPPGKVHVYEEGNRKQIEFCNIGDHLDYMRGRIKTKHRLMTKKSDPIRLSLSIPPGLAAWLNKAYPTLFTDKGQLNQFLKAFPKFNLDK